MKKTKTLVNDGEETENILYSTRVFGVLASAPLSAFRSKGIFLGTSEYPKKSTAEKVCELSQTGQKLTSWSITMKPIKPSIIVIQLHPRQRSIRDA